MTSEVDFKKLFMRNCRLRKLNLYIQSCETLRRFILLEWKPTANDLNEIDSAIKYVQKLPLPILEDLFSYFKSPNKEYYTCYILKHMEAWHVALFTYKGQKELVMDFLNKDFDLSFFLDVCGAKMLHLEELKLPEQCQLSANQCKILCGCVPHLQKFSLLAVDIANFAIQFVANLALKELELGGFIMTKSVLEISSGFVDPQLAVICREDSVVRTSLRVLKMGDTVNLESYILILRSMPNLEYLDFSHGSWLTRLPRDLQEKQFHLKLLAFCNLFQQVEKEMAIAINCCPFVIEVDLTTNMFSRDMLTMLGSWPKLTKLFFKVVSSRFFNESNTNNTPIEDSVIDMTDLKSFNLVEFSLRDRRNFWLSNANNLIQFLRICPRLKKLTFTECNGFDDQLALQTTRQLMSRSVEHIHMEFCNFLKPPGIRHFLNIPSLKECDVHLLLSHAEKRAFNVQALEEEAKRKGKILKIEITIRTLFHDLLSRLMY